jgi:hypothetical protein
VLKIIVNHVEKFIKTLQRHQTAMIHDTMPRILRAFGILMPGCGVHMTAGLMRGVVQANPGSGIKSQAAFQLKGI